MVTNRCPPASFAALSALGQVEFGGTAILVGASEDVALLAEIAAAVRCVDTTRKNRWIGLSPSPGEGDKRVSSPPSRMPAVT